MSRLLASADLLVIADHRMFGICDDGPDGPFSGPPTPGDGWVAAGTYEVIVGTMQDGVRVKLRIEVWDGSPEGGEDDAETVRIGFPSGRICLNEITAGIRRDVFTLPAPGDYYVQLSAQGGPETTEAYFALFDRFDTNDSEFWDAARDLEGQESFVARFWPVAGT